MRARIQLSEFPSTVPRVPPDDRWRLVHDFTVADRDVLADLSRWMVQRRTDPGSVATSVSAVLPRITPDGRGIETVWASLRDHVLPSAFPTDHPRYLAFVGGSPTPASIIADAALSAAAVYGGSELEAGQVVAVERAAMRWLCDVLGYREQAHGVFVSGGSMANLSALVAARHGRVASHGRAPGVILVGAAAHSSIRSAAAIMGCTVVLAGSADRPLNAEDLTSAFGDLDSSDVVAVVATAGATNTGTVDRIDEITTWCADRALWCHVDAAYGGAAMLSRPHRALFAGIERANSVTIDPHKWLFTPFDCAAIVYRDPEVARSAHRQHADYLDVVNEDDLDNPSDYAVHLSRRARGLPMWASLVANGTDAYVHAVERCMQAAAHAVKVIEASPHLELSIEPHLSVVLFRRRGWTEQDYRRWSVRALDRGMALVTPTLFDGQTVLRFCFVNPLTTPDDIDLIVTDLEHDEPQP